MSSELPGRVCYIAIFDLLGFKELVEKLELSLVVSFVDGFLEHAQGATEVPEEKLGRLLTIRMFQDTVVVLTQNVEPKHLQGLIQYCCAFVGFAFLQGIYLRGAICKGEAYYDEHMVIGKGFIKGYNMEQMQEWSGCWIDDECANEYLAFSKNGPDKDPFLYPYHIPLKSGPVIKLFALDWLRSIAHLKKLPGTSEGILRTGYDKLIKRLNGDNLTWDARRKLQNTEAFIRDSTFARRIPLESISSVNIEELLDNLDVNHDLS